MIDSLILHLSTVASETPVAGATGGEAGGSAIFMLLMFGLLALFIFATWRRNRKMREDVRQANEGAVLGAEVVTAGGIVGRVVGRDDERQRITLEFTSVFRCRLSGCGISARVTTQGPRGPELSKFLPRVHCWGLLMR